MTIKIYANQGLADRKRAVNNWALKWSTKHYIDTMLQVTQPSCLGRLTSKENEAEYVTQMDFQMEQEISDIWEIWKTLRGWPKFSKRTFRKGLSHLMLGRKFQFIFFAEMDRAHKS